MKIIVIRRNDGCKASLKGSNVWESGRTQSEAIGNLVIRVKDKLGIEIEFQIPKAE
jgi:hypothetical protein